MCYYYIIWSSVCKSAIDTKYDKIIFSKKKKRKRVRGWYAHDEKYKEKYIKNQEKMYFEEKHKDMEFQYYVTWFDAEFLV